MSPKGKRGKAAQIDVRSPADIPAFNKLFKDHPVVFVLIHADFCGHCQTYKEDVWNGLHNLPNRSAGLGSIHYDQLKHTPLENAKINGYPSILVVGKDGVPAEFDSEDGNLTNAMNSEDARNKKLMESLVANPSKMSLPNMKTQPNTNTENGPELAVKPTPLQNKIARLSLLKNKKSMNNADFENVPSHPPDMSRDVLNSQSANNSSTEFSPNENTPQPKAAVGGSLYQALMEATYKVAPAIALTAAGLATRRKRSKKSKRSRRSRL